MFKCSFSDILANRNDVRLHCYPIEHCVVDASVSVRIVAYTDSKCGQIEETCRGDRFSAVVL